MDLTLTQSEWRKRAIKRNEESKTIIDVRTAEEFSHGYISGAINIDIYKSQEFLDKIKTLDTENAYYVYCRSGRRSATAIQIMESHGFTKLYNLEGGILEYDGDLEVD